ncbi:NACHT domain-containing protein [Dictyobacter arantiisoli]|uniref:NACHT domain-containing protein n=1 Tax=Dictyobacter arantiisoli TaxID=2014874 RepID=A0A5A5T8I7_9CHLR|nr:NACHT domain-containing protein [Dictyobacter arantiisoli]GCF07791.1 hypothetical protein KDI_13550 [Dictyobacter arantiisoli]
MGNDGTNHQQMTPGPEQQSNKHFETELNEAQGTTIGQHNNVTQNFNNTTNNYNGNEHTPERLNIATPSPEELAAIYREKLLNDPGLNSMKMPGMSSPMQVSDLYVHVRLHKIQSRHSEKTSEQPKGTQDPLTVMQQQQNRLEQSNNTAIEPAQALHHYQRCVVLGDSGSGKTTLLKRLAILALQGKAHGLPGLPIFLNLHEAAQAQCENLFDYILHSYQKAYGLSLADITPFISQQLTDGNAFFLLDALDETIIGETEDEARASQKRIAEAIDRLASRFPQAYVMVTARRAGYFAHRRLRLFTELEIVDFLPRDIERFILKWFDHSDDVQRRTQGQSLIAELKNKPRIQALAANPLLLYLIVRTYESHQYQLPGSRAELYEQCVDMLLQRWDRDQQRERFQVLDAHQQLSLLVQLAAHFHQRGQRTFSEQQLVGQIMRYADLSEADEAMKTLKAITGDNSLLHETETGYYSFLHLTIQEYLTATHFKGKSDTIFDHLGDPWWYEVTLLMVPQLADAGPLLWHLSQEQKDGQYQEDIFASRLVLAGHCLATRPRLRTYKEMAEEIPEKLFEMIQDSRYAIPRQRCAEALAEIGNTESTIGPVNKLILSALRIGDAERKLDVLYAINRAGAPVLARPLLNMLSQGQFLWLAYYDADLLEATLSRLCDSSLLPDIYSFFTRPALHTIADTGINLASIMALVGGESTIQYIMNLSRNPIDQAVNGWIPVALGYTGHSSVIPFLIGGLLTKNTEFSLDCMTGLIIHGDPTIPERLTGLLADKNLTAESQRSIAMCLRALDDPSLQEKLWEVLTYEWLDIEAQSSLVYTLFKIANDEIRATLVKRYVCEPIDDPWPEYTHSAPDNSIKIEVLRAIGDTHYTPALQQVGRLLPLLSAGGDKRREVCTTLGMLNDPIVPSRLQAMLEEINRMLSVQNSTYSIDYDQTLGRLVDVLITTLNSDVLLHLLGGRELVPKLRTFIAQRLEETTRLFTTEFFLQLIDLLTQRTMMSEVRQQIARVIARHANGRRVAQKLLDSLPRSDIANDIHMALYQVCRRSGLTVIEEVPGSARFRLIKR